VELAQPERDLPRDDGRTPNSDDRIQEAIEALRQVSSARRAERVRDAKAESEFARRCAGFLNQGRIYVLPEEVEAFIAHAQSEGHSAHVDVSDETPDFRLVVLASWASRQARQLAAEQRRSDDDGIRERRLETLFRQLVRSPKGEPALMVSGSEADPLVAYAAARGVQAHVAMTDDIPLYYVIFEGYEGTRYEAPSRRWSRLPSSRR
jgi:hypothetical protein